MNGVLLDTSVWIEYFKTNPAYFKTCQYLMDQRMIWTLDIIFAELIQGAKGNRKLEFLDTYYQNLPKIDSKDLVYQSGIFSNKHQLISQGIGLIDSIIIFACLEENLQIWTLDKKISRFLNEKYPKHQFEEK
jgi:predicted nucleic acid-binding protein